MVTKKATKRRKSLKRGKQLKAQKTLVSLSGFTFTKPTDTSTA